MGQLLVTHVPVRHPSLSPLPCLKRVGWLGWGALLSGLLNSEQAVRRLTCLYSEFYDQKSGTKSISPARKTKKQPGGAWNENNTRLIYQTKADKCSHSQARLCLIHH